MLVQPEELAVGELWWWNSRAAGCRPRRGRLGLTAASAGHALKLLVACDAGLDARRECAGGAGDGVRERSSNDGACVVVPAATAQRSRSWHRMIG